MKTKIILAIIIMLSFFACKKSEISMNDLQCPVKAIQGEENDIIGKWKLVKQDNSFGIPKTIDYSCQSIVYEFKSDGNLLVTGDDKQHLSIPLGSHKFELTSIPLSDDPLKEVHALSIIGDSMSSWPCEITASQMTLSQAFLDGPALTFYRVQ